MAREYLGGDSRGDLDDMKKTIFDKGNKKIPSTFIYVSTQVG
jgi:hypothetical protein